MNAKLIKYVMLIINCLFISCAGETYHIIIEDLPPEEIQVTDTTVYVKLSFRAAVGGATSDGQTRTNDTINLPVGRYVTLYIYSEGETPETGNQLRQDKYTVQTAGYLTPVYQGISLAAGTYNIYAVSELNNTSDKTPNFDVNKSGIATTLYNELDYLWWSQTGVVVTTETPPIVTILFEHVATKVQITCVPEESSDTLVISDLTVGNPSTSGCTYQLATGYITPSTTLATSAQMAVKDNDIAYANYVPFNASNYSQLTGQAEIIINSVNIGWKNFILPLPNGNEFKAGYEYFYTVSFSSTHTRTYFDPIKGELKKVINNNFSFGKE